MFCPQCGNNAKDGAQFCPKCGYQLANRTLGAPQGQPREQKQLPSADGYAAPATPGPMPLPAPGAKPQPTALPAARKGLPVLPLAIAGVLVAAVVAFVVFNPIPKILGLFGIYDNKDITVTEEAPSSESPKENIIVSDLKLEEDALGRYVITGKVTNTSEESYDVDIDFSATRHHPDKYGEYQTDKTGLSIATITPFTRPDWGTLKVYDLKKGTREFTVYPDWASTEETLSDPEFEITDIKRSNAQSEWRFDHDNKIKINDTPRYTSDGKVELKFVNNTGLYLNETTVTVLCYNNDGIPSVERHGERNSGVIIESSTVDTLKPGDDGIFVCDVGEGYEKVEVIDITYTPDPSKSQLN